MQTRNRWLNAVAAVALSIGFAAAGEDAAPFDSESLQTPQQEIGAELAAGIRESLTGVTPEITLPAVDVQPLAPLAIGG
jgi:hypothetical protein